MKAVQIRSPPDGQPRPADLFVQDSIPVPAVDPDGVLIRVHATAVNRADTMQRRGLYPPPPGASDILGLEAAGIVEKTGANVTQFRPGDRVMALLSGGGYAQYCVADVGCCIPIPDGVSWTDAAAIPEVFLTAYQCLFLNAKLQPGQSVLIHAGASSVGIAAIQLSRAAAAQHVITTSSASKVEVCKKYGATTALSRQPTGPHAPARAAQSPDRIFAADVQDVVGPRGVDVILDPVFGNYMQENA
eukprot:EG_transcript_24767